MLDTVLAENAGLQHLRHSGNIVEIALQFHASSLFCFVLFYSRPRK